MNNKLKEVEDIFVETIGKTASAFGISRVVAQLYGLLYLSPQPLSLDEMSQRLRISKGNVSVNIRTLDAWQAVRKVWQKGSRKDYYTAELDIKKIALNKIKEGLNRRMGEVMGEISRIEEILKSMNKTNKGLTAGERKTLTTYRERIKKIKDLNNLVTRFLSLLKYNGF